MNNKIISIDTLKYYNDKLSNYVDEKVSDAVDNLELDELNAILVDTDAEADDPIVSDYVTETELNTALSNKMDKVTLAKVATSGSYNDLTNKPTIPTAVTESTVSGWGFTKNAGTYSKPSGGIPKTDLASAVQTSLGKADTALQSYTEQYKGTVTGVKINGTTKNPSSGVVDLGTVITSHQDISGKQDKLVSGTNIKTINGTSILGNGDLVIEGGSDVYVFNPNGNPAEEYAGLQNAVDNGKTVVVWAEDGGVAPVVCNVLYGFYDGSGEYSVFYANYTFIEEEGFTCYTSMSVSETAIEPKGILWTPIISSLKTINGESIIGSGDITISGGSSSGNGAYTEVNHGTSDTTFTLTPNTFHIWDEVNSLTLTLSTGINGVANEYLFQFTSGANATTLSISDDIKWTDGEPPTIEANKIYQISILKGLGSVLVWDNVVSIFPVTLSYTENNSELGTKVYNELSSIVGSDSGVLNDGDLTFIINNQSVIVTNVFFVSRPYEGYVLYDTGMEYYILRANGQITYYFYD